MQVRNLLSIKRKCGNEHLARAKISWIIRGVTRTIAVIHRSRWLTATLMFWLRKSPSPLICRLFAPVRPSVSTRRPRCKQDLSQATSLVIISLKGQWKPQSTKIRLWRVWATTINSRLSQTWCRRSKARPGRRRFHPLWQSTSSQMAWTTRAKLSAQSRIRSQTSTSIISQTLARQISLKIWINLQIVLFWLWTVKMRWIILSTK